MSSPTSSQLKRQIDWTTEMDLAMLRDVIRHEPYAAPHGSVLNQWATVVKNLIVFDERVDERSVRNHLKKLLTAYERANAKQLKLSGIVENVTELDTLLCDYKMRLEEFQSDKQAKHDKEVKRSADLVSAGELICEKRRSELQSV
ncbi:hypothetical protein AeMF1_010147 [Aphanomyces euteiches]|nr:hypothetical protein AeMF1_010147 [Aphanomyces euteiches]KAH9192136.1 hypothetical protein AeNC1_005878 [Aphanomyces euteiches]